MELQAGVKNTETLFHVKYSPSRQIFNDEAGVDLLLLFEIGISSSVAVARKPTHNDEFAMWK